MDHLRLAVLAKELKGLACIECTKRWLEKHEDLTDPIGEIKDCFALGLITEDLKKRLVFEVEEVKNN